MTVETSRFTVETDGFSDVVDITGQVEAAVEDSGISSGLALVFVPGSTASVTTIEFEPGAVADLQRSFRELVPEGREYAHNQTWHDGNGFAHVRAALGGAGFTVPFVNGRLLLWTWQQIVLVDHDNRPRRREAIVQIVGERMKGEG